MTIRVTRGLKEAPRPSHFTYASELFEPGGRYAYALDQVRRVVKSGWPDWRKITLNLVHECEQARSWLEMVRSSGEDFETAQIRHQDAVRASCERAIRALDELAECDHVAAYTLRAAFEGGLFAALGPPGDVDYVLPDANRDDGGLHIKLDGERRRAIEAQFAARASMTGFDVIIAKTRERLELWSMAPKDPWHRVANLRFTPPLSKKSRAAIVRRGDPILGPAVVGLGVALSEWFRLWSSETPERQRWIGDPMSTKGRPHWRIVVEFVNAALKLEEEEGEESLRQRVAAVCRGREVRVDAWPQAAIREPQVQKI